MAHLSMKGGGSISGTIKIVTAIKIAIVRKTVTVRKIAKIAQSAPGTSVAGAGIVMRSGTSAMESHATSAGDGGMQHLLLTSGEIWSH